MVDSNELGHFLPFQLKQLKYEDPKDEGAFGATMDCMVDYGVDHNIPLKIRVSCALCDRGSMGDSPVSCMSNSDELNSYHQSLRKVLIYN